MKTINKDSIIPYNKLVEDNGKFYLFTRETLLSQWSKIAEFDDEIAANQIFKKWLDGYDEENCEYDWSIVTRE